MVVPSRPNCFPTHGSFDPSQILQNHQKSNQVIDWLPFELSWSNQVDHLVGYFQVVDDKSIDCLVQSFFTICARTDNPKWYWDAVHTLETLEQENHETWLLQVTPTHLEASLASTRFRFLCQPGTVMISRRISQALSMSKSMWPAWTCEMKVNRWAFQTERRHRPEIYTSLIKPPRIQFDNTPAIMVNFPSLRTRRNVIYVLWYIHIHIHLVLPRHLKLVTTLPIEIE